MCPAPHDVRSVGLQRGSLVAITSAGILSLVLACVWPRLEPWLGPPRAALFALTAGAAICAAAMVFGTRKAPEWSSADDMAWIVALGALCVLAGACTAPVGLGLLLYAAVVFALAERDPSNTLAAIACTTTALIPVVRLVLIPTVAMVIPLLCASIVVASAFVVILGQTRRLGRALAERDAALFEQASAPRSGVSTQASLPSTGPRSGHAWRSGSGSPEPDHRARNGSDGQDQGWDALVERLRSSVTVMAENAGVAASVQVELSGLAPPSSKIRMHLLHIAQEATTQALRHGGPRSIVVLLRRAEGGVVFELQDDGEGSEAVRQKRSLAPLRGRAAALGGTAEVRRSDDGWVTRVRLPCEQLN